MTYRFTPALTVLVSIAAAIGCGDDVPDPTDSGSRIDAAAIDSGVTDSGAALDSGAIDSGPRADASPIDAAGADGATTDAPTTGDAGPTACGPDLGAMCDDSTPCAASLECEIGRCIPQDRPICGGFAGDECEGGFPYCLYLASADYGPCVTPAEAACLCAASPTSYASCPGS